MTKLDAKTVQRIEDAGLTPEKSRTAFKIALNILNTWGVDDEKKLAVLGLRAGTALERYLEMAESFSDELQFRLSIIIGLHADLRKLFLHEQHRREWLTHPHASLNEKSPIDIISAGNPDEMLHLRKRLKSLMY